MQYLLVHVVDEEVAAVRGWDGEAQAALEAWLDETIGRAVNLHGSRLRPASDATTVKVRRGELLVTDGPFAETKEQVAGYDLLVCTDLDEAVGWAAKHPSVHVGAIEVRALSGEQPARGLPGVAAGQRRYMMLVCTDPEVDAAEFDNIAPVEPWVEEMDGRGPGGSGARWRPSERPYGKGEARADLGHRRPLRRNQGADRRVRHPGLR